MSLAPGSRISNISTYSRKESIFSSDDSSNQNSELISHQSKKITKKSQENPLRRKKRQWQSHEDAQLLDLLSHIGEKWTQIGKIIGGRTGKQVRERYLYTLNPNLKKDKWTEEEDSLLISLYQSLGNKWHQIAQNFPGRSENQIKNRFKARHQKKICSDNSSTSQRETLLSIEALSPLVEYEVYLDLEYSCEVVNKAIQLNEKFLGDYDDIISCSNDNRMKDYRLDYSRFSETKVEDFFNF